MKTPRHHLVLLATTALFAFPALAESDAEITELKAQLKAMSDRLATLEGQQQSQAKAAANGFTDLTRPQALKVPADNTKMAHETTSKAAQVTTGAPPSSTVPGEGEPVVGGSLPGSFRLPGTKTSVRFGGFVKLDAIYDANHAYGGQFANFANIPLDTSAQAHMGSQFNMHARSTRIGIETSTPTDLGPLKTFIEGDFFGANAANRKTLSGEGIQLRHAYGQVGRVLAGQTWSNFMDLDAYPESFDFVGPVGLSFIRQAQVRYTDKFNDKTTWSVAAESPQSDITSTVTTNVNLSDMPDFTAKVQYKDTFGHVAVRALLRHLDEGSTLTEDDDGTFGYGLGLSGKFLVGKKDSFVYEIQGGDGIGRYIFDVANSNNGSTYANGTTEAQFAYGGYAGYQHYWNDDWRSNFLLGYAGVDNDVSRTGTGVNKEIASGHVNLIWSPVPAYRVGIEYMHGYRKIESGVSGDLDRIQTSFMYLF
jgi:hypothetical protein